MIKTWKFAIRILVLLAMILWPLSSFAENLEITEVKVEIVGEKVQITWKTNMPSIGRLDYGLTENYDRYISTGAQVYRTEQKVEIGSLQEKKLYHYKITAWANGQTTSTYDAAFRTDEIIDKTAPKILKVNVVYVTSETVTIQWETDEKTYGKVLFGKTPEYGSSSGSGLKTKHDVTIYRLQRGQYYHFNIEAEDQDKNKVRWYDIVVQTPPHKTAENVELEIDQIQPISADQNMVGIDRITISWRTNKLSTGFYAYGTQADRLSRTIEIKDVPRGFFHTATITKLKPNTTYYFQAISKDIFGKTVKSQIFGVKTYPMTQVLGTKVTNGAITSATRLIKDKNTGKIYFLFRNADGSRSKIHLTSPSVFNSYSANKWGDVVTVSGDVANGVEDVRLVKSPDSPAVYLLQGQQKRPIVNAAVFEREGYRWSDIKIINQAHLQSYSTGQSIQ